MAFSDKKKYKTLGDVLKTFGIQHQLLSNIGNIQPVTVPQNLKDDIDFAVKNLSYRASEEAICECILFPILKEVWKPFADTLGFWSHKSIEYDKELKGTPDYLITKRSPLGYIVFDQPYIAVVEAKLDDFIGGWAQCCVEMLAMQKINGDAENPIFGIVSNGDVWQFAKLENNTFFAYETIAILNELTELFSTLTFFMEECKRIYGDKK